MKRIVGALAAVLIVAGALCATATDASARWRGGGAVAAGVIGGLAAGAIIGGVIAAPPAYA